MKKNTNKNSTHPSFRKKWSIALVAMFLVCTIVAGSIVLTGMTVAEATNDVAPPITVATLEELLVAIEEAESEDTILIAGKISVPNEPITIGNGNKTITLRRAEGFTEEMISVQPPANYIPQNGIVVTFLNLIIDGANIENYAEAAVAIYNSSEFKNVSFINNTLDMTGGVVLANRGTIIFDNCFFSDNSSYSAGHLSVHSLATVKISNSRFIKGYAITHGGAISNGGTLYLNNCEFADNHTDLTPEHPNIPNSGGAVHNVKTVNMTNCTFYNNQSYNGGAIYSSTNSQLQLDSCILMNNSAEMGGGIFGLSRISIINSPILRNTATKEAADIYSGIDLSISNTSNDIFETVFSEKELTPLGWHSDFSDSRFNGIFDEAQSYETPLNDKNAISLIFVFEEDIIPENDKETGNGDVDNNNSDTGDNSDNGESDSDNKDTDEDKPNIDDKAESNDESGNNPPDSNDTDSGNNESDNSGSESSSEGNESGDNNQETESDKTDNKEPATPPISNNSGSGSGNGGKHPGSNTKPDNKLNTDENLDSVTKASLDSTSALYLQGYMDAIDNLDASITRGQMAQIIYRLLTPESREYFYTTDDYFSDIGDIRERDAINTLANANIIEGYNNQYRPHEYLTKAELATIAARFFDIESSPSDFIDMLGHWAENYVNECVSAGLIINGEIFSPDTPVSYGQAIDFISHVLEYGGTA